MDATRQSRDINKGGSGSSSGIDEENAAIKAEIEKWMKKEEGKYMASTVTAETDPWLRHTGWEEVLAGSKHGLVKTAAFAATATAQEPELVRITESWERVLRRSLDTLTAVSNFKDILKWFAGPQMDNANQRPFERLEKASLSKYSQTFARLLCYVMRTAPTSIDEETETGVRFTEAQLSCVSDVRVAVAVDDADEDELDSTVMALIISLLGQKIIQASQYHLPVMHYLAVRGVDPKTQGFYPSFRYTPYLAHMLWMIRLLVLESALSEQGWPRLGLPSRQEFVEEKGVVAVAERIQAVRREYLCEGSYTPASSILSQLAFGQKQSRHHSAEANIY